ncbi:MAG: asparagine synthase (glutamine-hydrolyzing) [Thalassospira sp.]|uniref:asparagine synthase (glutamine-hydrolyzing) n=1 Tax=Thalassospira sp. TaxID=1912094 RepID=UPI0032EB05CF
MCGIAGIFETKHRGQFDLRKVCTKMGDAISHRGPDAGEVWLDDVSGLALAHRRLSIIDLSAAGGQPMMSSCERYILCYNGEVYNASPLRKELEAQGIKFKGRSDTEVILESCAVFGLKETVSQLVGMFAFALWDRQKKTLSLVRDRLGIKPLYWSFMEDGTFIFGSELKALKAHPNCSSEVDRNSVSTFLRHNYIPSPHSIYRGVKKLSPGRILTIDINRQCPEIVSYWSMDAVYEHGRVNQFSGSDDEALGLLEDTLSIAVQGRMISDVPLGAFLSGGIDSSTVVALMQKMSDRPVRSFSIGFNEKGYNEAQHAKEIARHLGTDHTELYVTSTEAQAVIPALPTYFDEPFADSSQIPTYLVSAMTKKYVTVALSGDGGDELFAGYTRYAQAAKFDRLMSNVPGVLKKAASIWGASVPPAVWDFICKGIPSSRRPQNAGDKVRRIAKMLDSDSDSFYRKLISHWHHPDEIVLGAREHKGLVWDETLQQRVPNFLDRMQFLDLLTYLPDDILTKVDRASMAVGLEARVPILDHRVVELAWRLPQHMKIRHGNSKWLLKQLLYKYVPKEIVDRPKMGFGVPIGSWLRGPLKEWAEYLLSEDTFRKHGLLEAASVRRLWGEHKSGKENWQYQLWDVLMLHAWAEHNSSNLS